jgi:hypothetical protein
MCCFISQIAHEGGSSHRTGGRALVFHGWFLALGSVLIDKLP